MDRNDPFIRAFRNACFTGELSKAHEAIATGRLTTDDLDEGLKLAVYKSYPDIVAALFDAGARVSPYTVNSLPGGDLQQHPSVVRHFLDHGLDPNTRLSTGEPLLPMFHNPLSAREMLSRGADPNLCGPRGLSPFARAIVSIKEEETSLLELYLEYGARLESELLFFAAAPRVTHGDIKTRFLLDKGLDPNVTSAEWGSPLHRAVYHAKPKIVKLLLDAGADPIAISTGTKTYNQTPAQVAAERVQHPETRETIRSLLESR